ncbi:MAG: hypothetical protein N3D77_14870 [Geminicoccaceae bacterium]|nr:hypothetical protein [Geminicoccaceae bacterium]
MVEKADADGGGGVNKASRGRRAEDRREPRLVGQGHDRHRGDRHDKGGGETDARVGPERGVQSRSVGRRCWTIDSASAKRAARSGKANVTVAIAARPKSSGPEQTRHEEGDNEGQRLAADDLDDPPDGAARDDLAGDGQGRIPASWTLAREQDARPGRRPAGRGGSGPAVARASLTAAPRIRSEAPPAATGKSLRGPGPADRPRAAVADLRPARVAGPLLGHGTGERDELFGPFGEIAEDPSQGRDVLGRKENTATTTAEQFGEARDGTRHHRPRRRDGAHRHGARIDQSVGKHQGVGLVHHPGELAVREPARAQFDDRAEPFPSDQLPERSEVHEHAPGDRDPKPSALRRRQSGQGREQQIDAFVRLHGTDHHELNRPVAGYGPWRCLAAEVDQPVGHVMNPLGRMTGGDHSPARLLGVDDDRVDRAQEAL